MEINITHLYPDLLNLYGDRGNIAALSKRLSWRNIGINVNEVTGEELLPCDTDILLLGGGAEGQQAAAKKLLSEKRGELRDYIESGGVMLAVCGGFEMLAELGLIPASVKSDVRVSDNKIIFCEIDGKSFTVSGFENHSSAVIANGLQSLGRVVYGRGAEEGIIYRNVFATFMYGPLLPKNPELTDVILTRALRGKYPDFTELSPLDDEFEELANKNIADRCIEK